MYRIKNRFPIRAAAATAAILPMSACEGQIGARDEAGPQCYKPPENANATRLSGFAPLAWKSVRGMIADGGYKAILVKGQLGDEGIERATMHAGR